MGDEYLDKQWAAKYLLDPLSETQPGEETGPGTHFRSTFARPPSEVSSIPSTKRSSQPKPASKKPVPSEISVDRKLSKASGASPPSSGRDIPFRKMSNRSHRDPQDAYPTPPSSGSPHRQKFARHRSSSYNAFVSDPKSNNPYRQEAFAGVDSGRGNRRRTSSLGERYNGDKSHQPLAILKKDERSARRSPHMRRHHQIGIDVIDNLDNVGGRYHHEGPFDATYYSRNTSFTSSPIQALTSSNEEALKATPREKIIDSLRRHRPLDGVATYAPGTTDEMGNAYDYEEGANMMIENGGNYKRWPGVKYLPEDVKGKGEPSYTIEKALKDEKRSASGNVSGHRRLMSNEIEMTSRPKSSGEQDARGPLSKSMWDDGEMGLRRSSTTGGKLRRRLGLGSQRKS